MSHSVLAGVDGSPCSLAAADWAAREAKLRGVALRLVHVCPALPDSVVPAPALTACHGAGELMLQRALTDLGDRYPDTEIRGEQVDGAPAAALLAAAEGSGLIVVGTRGSGGFDGLAVGSAALGVAAAAACPFVLVPERPDSLHGETTSRTSGVGRVVVGFDARRPAAAVEFAFSAAEVRGALLRVVRAWSLPAESMASRTPFVTEEDRATWEDREVLELSDAVRAWQEKFPRVTVGTDVVLLHPAQALLNASRGADLLVVGSRTDPRKAGCRLGPVAHAVLHHARCPVAVVPHVG